MADKKISELIQTNNITGEELIPIVIDGQNKTVKAKFLKGAENLGEDFIDLVGDDGEVYRVKVVNGKLVPVNIKAFNAEPITDHKLFYGMLINQMYGGGDAIEGTPVSHGFIELYNFNKKEINLKGLYLFYRAKSGSWQSLALEGIVPAKHSFLIRCAQHTAPFSQGVRCNIVDYDMQWDIKLSDKGFSCYLAVGAETPEDNPVRQTKNTEGVVNWTNERYVDLLGAGGVNPDDTVWAYETRYLQCMDKNTAVHRIDFANSLFKATAPGVNADTDFNIGSNGATKGFNDCDCEPINYKTCNVDVYRPRSLKDGRWNEFYDKPKQKEVLPSMINIMYGKNGDTDRTFTFQTPLTEINGFVKIRKEGEVKWESHETSIEMAINSEGDTTVHRCIVRDLEPGNYEYMVGIEGCSSDTYSFVVKEFNEEQPMRILWTTDQQSWTKREYDVWQMCSRFLNKKAELFDFHLNTGVTYSSLY